MTNPSHPYFELDFSTREFLQMAPIVDHDQLRTWQQRGIIVPKNYSTGGQRGKERRWGFTEVVYIMVFALLAKALPDLQEAKQWAPKITGEILGLFVNGLDGDKCMAAPIYVFPCDGTDPEQLAEGMSKISSLARYLAWRPSVLVAPGHMAIELHDEVQMILDRRAAAGTA